MEDQTADINKQLIGVIINQQQMLNTAIKELNSTLIDFHENQHKSELALQGIIGQINLLTLKQDKLQSEHDVNSAALKANSDKVDELYIRKDERDNFRKAVWAICLILIGAFAKPCVETVLRPAPAPVHDVVTSGR